jgi:hypothetical protein
MSTIEQIKPFTQVPYCEPDTVLTITGEEFEIIQQTLNIFKAPLDAIQSIFDRNINQGNITIKYVLQDGSEITKEQAIDYLNKATQYLKDKEKVPN